MPLEMHPMSECLGSSPSCASSPSTVNTHPESDSPGVWVLAAHMGNQDGVPGSLSFSLAHPCLLWAFGKQANRISLSLPLKRFFKWVKSVSLSIWGPCKPLFETRWVRRASWMLVNVGGYPAATTEAAVGGRFHIAVNRGQPRARHVCKTTTMATASAPELINQPGNAIKLSPDQVTVFPYLCRSRSSPA